MALYTTARFGLAAGLTDDVRTACSRAPIDVRTFVRDNATVWRPATLPAA